MRPETDEMLMIEPLPDSIIDGKEYLAISIMDATLILMASSQPTGSSSIALPTGPVTLRPRSQGCRYGQKHLALGAQRRRNRQAW